MRAETVEKWGIKYDVKNKKYYSTLHSKIYYINYYYTIIINILNNNNHYYEYIVFHVFKPFKFFIVCY